MTGVSIAGEGVRAAKPPIGPVPRSIHDLHVAESRVRDLVSAISARYDASMEPPQAWIEELAERCGDVLRLKRLSPAQRGGHG